MTVPPRCPRPDHRLKPALPAPPSFPELVARLLRKRLPFSGDLKRSHESSIAPDELRARDTALLVVVGHPGAVLQDELYPALAELVALVAPPARPIAVDGDWRSFATVNGFPAVGRPSGWQR